MFDQFKTVKRNTDTIVTKRHALPILSNRYSTIDEIECKSFSSSRYIFFKLKINKI